MKKLIVTFIILFCSAFAIAQKIELGLSAGVSYTLPVNTASGVYGYIPGSYKASGAISSYPYYCFKAAYNAHHLQAGLMLGTSVFSYYASYKWLNGPLISTESSKVDLIEVANFIKVFTNYVIKARQMYFYGGLSGGYMPAPHDKSFRTNIWTAGLQIGDTWYFTKHFGINAEIQPNYVHIARRNLQPDIYPEQRYASYSNSLLNIPVSVGLRYQFVN